MSTSNMERWMKDGHAQERFFGPPTELDSVFVTYPSKDTGYELPDFPPYIGMQTTNACNFRCSHCFVGHGQPSRSKHMHMPWEILEAASDQARDNKASMLMNYDGEPFMYPRFVDALKLVSDKGIDSNFNTNASMLTPEAADRILGFYTGHVSISLDVTKEWFEKIRVGSNYDKVAANARYFMKKNRSLGRPVRTAITVCNFGQTIDERKQFIDEWLPLVDSITFGEVFDGDFTVISDPFTLYGPLDHPLCILPWQTLAVLHNGDVICCDLFVDDAEETGAIMGNIKNETLKEIWHGERFAAFRNRFAEKGYWHEKCRKCERWRSQFLFADQVLDDMVITRTGNLTVVRNK